MIESIDERIDSISVPNCGHRFCRECFVVFLESSINSGKLDLKCFHLRRMELVSESEQQEVTKEEDGTVTAATATAATPMDEIWEPYDKEKHVICGQKIDKEFVSQILGTHDTVDANSVHNVTIKLSPADMEGGAPYVQRINNITKGAQLISRYERLLFMKDHEDGRECPSCFYLQQCHEIDRGKPWSYYSKKEVINEGENKDDTPPMNPNDVMCENPECLHIYCFEHSDAHPGRSCDEYRLQTAEETAVSESLIANTSKPCPGCGIPVTKLEGAGCNHMKCPDCGCTSLLIAFLAFRALFASILCCFCCLYTP